MALWTTLIGTPPRLARRLTFATACGLFMGLIGPFGSYDVQSLERVASWVASFWAGALILGAALNLAGLWRERSGAPLLFAMAVALVLATVPLAGIVSLIFHHVAGVRDARLNALRWYAQVLAISAPAALGYVFISELMMRPRAPSVPALEPLQSPPPSDATDPALLPPPWRGRDVLALQMEDHYVRVHAAAGSELVLMPMGQAVAAMADVEGMRVHRSWWVARSAVTGSIWQGRNLRVRLSNDVYAPVARTSVAQLRASGWLETV